MSETNLKSFELFWQSYVSASNGPTFCHIKISAVRLLFGFTCSSSLPNFSRCEDSHLQSDWVQWSQFSSFATDFWVSSWTLISGASRWRETASFRVSCLYRGLLRLRPEPHGSEVVHRQEPEGIPADADLQQLGVSEGVGGAPETRVGPSQPQHHSGGFRGSASALLPGDRTEPQTATEDLSPSHEGSAAAVISASRLDFLCLKCSPI